MFEQPALTTPLFDPSDLFYVSLQGDDIQEFDTRWNKALLFASEVPEENVPESLYKMRIRDSVQFLTVLAKYDQEIDREKNNVRLSEIEDQDTLII